ncbi:glycosyltransferase family 4 protein [Bacillus suaedae]|uniref:glycosyltransferase family 4 protein n=1 Tax=Halalkalibacter suaedae TaxID=2822140 RepID=UPI001FF0B544|nr:glycosyltransferase family 4 protein [Bacillus suaedae]
MVKKVLYCATVDYHFSAFHLPYMQWFKEQGWDVHVAAAGNNELPFTDKKFTIPIHRSPFKLSNFKAYKQLRTLMKEHDYDIIHSHTPLGGVIARLAARKARKQGTKVIYTAHGFHFCKGAPLLNWLVYYPIEKYLSKDTDCLITINSEDYQLAKDHHFKAKKIKHINGVGVDTERYKPVSEKGKEEAKRKFGYQASDFLLIYAAEFNKNKNQQLLIKALARVKDELPVARLLLAGEGPLKEQCRELAENLGIEDRVEFMGFRHDLEHLLPACDLAVASSLREGLPVNIMEAMACGLPVVASQNRGHRELIAERKNGFLVDPYDVDGFASRLEKVYFLKQLRYQLGAGSLVKVKEYSIQNTLNQTTATYKSYMEQEELGWAVQ